MNLYQLEYFRVLCKYGSYTNASRELNITQSGISIAIKTLEKECGGNIIDRKSNSFALTKKGETLLSWAVTIHNDVENMLRAIDVFSARSREVIRLSLPFSLCPEILSDVIPSFNKLHTDTAMHLIQADPEETSLRLMNGDADLSILCRNMLISTLDSCHYKDLEYWVCFSPTHPFNGSEIITLDMLKDETLIIPKGATHIFHTIKAYFQSFCETPRIIIEDVFPEDVWKLAQQGKGIGFVPEHKHVKHRAPLFPPITINLDRKAGQPVRLPSVSCLSYNKRSNRLAKPSLGSYARRKDCQPSSYCSVRFKQVEPTAMRGVRVTQ